MKPGEKLYTVVSRIVGALLGWPVEKVGKSLQRLAEARERFADRLRSLDFRRSPSVFPYWRSGQMRVSESLGWGTSEGCRRLSIFPNTNIGWRDIRRLWQHIGPGPSA